MKDANDLLIAGTDITSMPTEAIDIYCCKQQIAKYPDDQQAQYKAVEKYIKTVKSHLIKSDIASMLAKTWGKEVSEVKAQLNVAAISTDEKLHDFADILDCLTEFNQTLKEEEIGIGYPSVDANVKFAKKDVVLLGAYSNHGKTDNAAESMLHWIVRLKKRVLFFSLEMPKERFIKTIISKIIQVPKYKVRTVISPEVERQVVEKIGKYLQIIDKNNLTIDEIDEYIKLAVRKFNQPVDIVCIDYFGYIKGTGTLEGEAAVAKQLKAVAKDNNVVLFVLAQFNKASQSSEKGQTIKEPMPKDLKGANDLYASCDVIYFIWRPVKMAQLSLADAEKLKYITMLKIDKWRDDLRNGVSHFTLRYNPETGRLYETAAITW